MLDCYTAIAKTDHGWGGSGGFSQISPESIWRCPSNPSNPSNPRAIDIPNSVDTVKGA